MSIWHHFCEELSLYVVTNIVIGLCHILSTRRRRQDPTSRHVGLVGCINGKPPIIVIIPSIPTRFFQTPGTSEAMGQSLGSTRISLRPSISLLGESDCLYCVNHTCKAWISCWVAGALGMLRKLYLQSLDITLRTL